MNKTNNTKCENKESNQDQNTASQGANAKYDFGQSKPKSAHNASHPNEGSGPSAQGSSCSSEQKASGSCKRQVHKQDEDTGVC